MICFDYVLKLVNLSVPSGELRDWLEAQDMTHTRGRRYHPMTQGKIERYYRSMKNQILLENYYLPDELKKCIGQIVSYYNNERYHESLDNLTPADVYFGRGEKILIWRAKIKNRCWRGGVSYTTNRRQLNIHR